MTVKLPTEHHLEFLSLKEAAQVRLSLHLSKCHIVGNHMLRLHYTCKSKHCTLISESERERLSIINASRSALTRRNVYSTDEMVNRV